MDLRWFDVSDVSDVWEGDIADFDVEGEEVLIAHLDGGEFKAFQGMCPHQEISLADGEMDVDASTLTCSGHTWQFDLYTGKGINPTGCQLYEYPVRVAGEKIQIGIPQDGQRHYNRFAGS